jgi:hypothetical protein
LRVTYCELWSDQTRAPIGEMGEGAARKLDSQGKRYSVVIGDPASPDTEVTVHWQKSYLAVSFIDEQGRTHVQYVFTKVDEKRLFLSEVTIWTYPDGARFKFEANRIENILIKPDGYSRKRIDDKSSNNIEVSESTDVPVDSNWEPVPVFGEWDSVIRYERD